MAKSEILTNQEEDCKSLHWWCPGCNQYHAACVEDQKKRQPVWSWNGFLDAPSLFPSFLCGGDWEFKTNRCHSFITEGKIHFCGDCYHDLRGQIVDIPDLP